jgi:HK97 family phage portal protein
MQLISLNLPDPPNFKMAGTTSTLADPSVDLVQALVGFPTAAGKPVTRYTAARIVSFMSGIKMLAQDLAKMPLILRETQIVNGRQRTLPAIEDPLYPILKDVPNVWQTSYEMRFFLWCQLLMSSNAYAQKITNQAGDIIALMPLNAWAMSLDWDLSDRRNPVPLWRYEDPNNRRVFRSEELWRVTNMNMDGSGITGTAITALAKEALSVIMAAEEVAGRNFANGLGVGGFITFPPVEGVPEVDEKQAQAVYDQLKKNFSGSQNAGKFAMIPYGAKFEKMTFNAQESQLLESRKWNEEEVIRLLGGAPLLVKMGLSGQNSTNASNTAFLDDYFNTCLLPHTTAIEQSITRDLIRKQDRGRLYAKHSADIILRGSPKERAETNQVLIQSFQMTPNEARAIEDRDAIEGGDFLTGGTGTPIIFDTVEQEFFIPGQQVPEDDETVTDPNAEPGEAGSDTAGGDDSPVVPAKQPEKPNKAEARLSQIANSLAERVIRKAAKADVDAKFVSEVLNCSLNDAEGFTAKYKTLTPDEQRSALVALVHGDSNDSQD